ncbi:anthranilate synthase component II [Sulfoacidibacillus thermotolerans]|uniref:Anthranilate/aminodeoxychorismate synthase component II n=1 Tax=Sulfoacidibacillus thermotolerans TaxID=1765684 RepID=A0A2U3D8Y9_SULT2|nr:aminodeoxychorismate/anthranilate synthase component II [Sulfoacidibacillus thermotolerans]PWI57743.1 anthranilate/aminodeoxychorismate synthase component II [Sulfoacidibacillus thermotolerans]
MIVVIDNYDSFTFNLVQYMMMAGAVVKVFRNDEVTVDELRVMQPNGIVLSPGPCSPTEAGISVEVVQRLAYETPILGVCLGHQSIAQAFGARIIRATEIMHGKVSVIEHTGDSELFRNLPNRYLATRYHSLVVDPVSLPDSLRVTARTDDGVIMALQHQQFPVYGVQFHPEAVLTEYGHELIENFLEIAHEVRPSQAHDDVNDRALVEDVSAGRLRA